MSGPKRDNISAFSSGGPFAGFEAKDFDAYEQKKWSSNAYTLARRTAKDKLLAVAHDLYAELAEEIGKLELFGTDEAPSVANGRKVDSQSAFFIRDAETRAGLKSLLNTTDLGAGNLFDIALQHQHACLVLRLDFAGVAVGIEVAGKARVDRDNLAQKLKNDWAIKKVIELCVDLPNGTTLSLGDADVLALDVDAGALDTLSDQLGESDAGWVAIARIPRDEPIVNSASLTGTLVEMMSNFIPLYDYLAWSRDNDHTKLKQTLKKTEETRQKQQKAAMNPGDRVTIMAGLFSGRAGYLAEVDSKGKAKVMVGPVSVSVDAKDVKPV